MPINGRQKGAKAEREVARLVTEWWRQAEPTVQFVRTPSSGGWSTPEIRATFQACGDLMTDAEVFPWVVEVKRKEGWSWEVFLAGKASPVWSWWVQAQAAAEKQGGRPCLWFRQNRWPDWRVMLHRDSPEATALARAGAAAIVTSLWPGHCPGRAVSVYSSLVVLAVDPLRLARRSPLRATAP